jgi:MFS family permease
VGGIVYDRFLQRMTSKRLLNLSILFGVLATLAFLLMTDQTSAVMANFVSGFAAMIAMVASLTLAADYCPKEAEGFAYAILMSISNMSGSASDNLGSFLYEDVFHNRLGPLIWASAAVTALGFALVPILRLGNKKQGDVVLAAAAWGGDAKTSPARPRE